MTDTVGDDPEDLRVLPEDLRTLLGELRVLLRETGAEGDAGLSEPEAPEWLLAALDARIEALRGEGFSQENVTRMARLIRGRAVLVRRMGTPPDGPGEGGASG